MPTELSQIMSDFDASFEIFHELMSWKVREILLVSTPYDAWILEQDCCLSERIINEYRGLNLSHPPRLNWVGSAEKALTSLGRESYDMVVTMPRLSDMDAFLLGREIKKTHPQLPVIMLAHSSIPDRACYVGETRPPGIDHIFAWTGNTDILLASIKSAEDARNVDHDTEFADIRVIIFVEDSPVYLSLLLPILYKELVRQTQAVMREGLNEEHRLLTMRARPKILVAEDYETAMSLYRHYEPYVFGVISDVRYMRNCQLNGEAGIDFLKTVKKERFDIPMLLTSSEPSNADKAAEIPATFVDKNSPSLLEDISTFFVKELGFGEFVFRMPDGTEISRANDLLSLEQQFQIIPEESFVHHCNRNDFSRWLFARTETVLASKFRPLRGQDFENVQSHRDYLISAIRTRRKQRQKGIVVDFDPQHFDPDTTFLRIGKGSLGGKARGLAFVSSLLKDHVELHEKFSSVDIIIPQTLVITTEGFESFVQENDLRWLAKEDLDDETVAGHFLQGRFPDWLTDLLRSYLELIGYPLAVRSSSLLEDAQFHAYAGLYRTYMIPNNCPDLETRLEQLIQSIKLVYASTYFQGPKAFSSRVGQRTEDEQMAVIIQRLVGERYGDHFYPAISGVAQSHNYYPFSKMHPEDGIVTIAMGLGKMVVEGERTLRFSPRYPQILPQRSRLEDILDNAQQSFYALNLNETCHYLGVNDTFNLSKLDIFEARNDSPLSHLASFYQPDQQRLRDTMVKDGYPVLTFSRVLKYDTPPLAPILTEVLELGKHGMGCPVELEFSVSIPNGHRIRPQFAFLQLRPMSARAELMNVSISDEELDQGVCVSENALGNGDFRNIRDILYVRPDTFDPSKTVTIAREIGNWNARMLKENKKYLLIGPGRWGSADRWLGIPVSWKDISGVGAIVETESSRLQAEPSQGSHFFHNITNLGIGYITLKESAGDFLDWDWLGSQPHNESSDHVVHVRLDKPLKLKIDGRSSRCVLYPAAETVEQG
jgi:hypothetical protein